MTKVGIADAAVDLDPYHAKGDILFVGDDVFFYRLGKTRPAGARVKFYAGIKQFSIAADAVIFTRIVTAAEFSAEAWLGTFLTGDAELFGR